MLRHLSGKILTLYLIASLFILSLPAPAWAMFIPTHAADARSADMARIQATLESTVIKQRLMDYGLSPAETVTRLGALSEEQVHQLAANLDAVQAGGDSVGGVVVLLLVVLVVIVALEVTGHHIIIKR